MMASLLLETGRATTGMKSNNLGIVMSTDIVFIAGLFPKDRGKYIILKIASLVSEEGRAIHSALYIFMTWLDLPSEERKVLIMVAILASEAGRAFCKLSPDPIAAAREPSSKLHESMHYCKGGQFIHLQHLFCPTVLQAGRANIFSSRTQIPEIMHCSTLERWSHLAY